LATTILLTGPEAQSVSGNECFFFWPWAPLSSFRSALSTEPPKTSGNR